MDIKVAILKRGALVPFETISAILVTLSHDASDEGMGAVLKKELADETMKSVLYWSSQFRVYENNYSVEDKEALACVASITKLRKYLLGRPFTLKADYRILVTLLSQSKIERTISRIERWREKLAGFDYKVVFIKDKENEIVDWLSRSSGEISHS